MIQIFLSTMDPGPIVLQTNYEHKFEELRENPDLDFDLVVEGGEDGRCVCACPRQGDGH